MMADKPKRTTVSVGSKGEHNEQTMWPNKLFYVEGVALGVDLAMWLVTGVCEGRSKTHIIKSCRSRFFFNLECLKPASRKSRARPAQGPRKAS